MWQDVPGRVRLDDRSSFSKEQSVLAQLYGGGVAILEVFGVVGVGRWAAGGPVDLGGLLQISAALSTAR